MYTWSVLFCFGTVQSGRCRPPRPSPPLHSLALQSLSGDPCNDIFLVHTLFFTSLFTGKLFSWKWPTQSLLDVLEDLKGFSRRKTTTGQYCHQALGNCWFPSNSCQERRTAPACCWVKRATEDWSLVASNAFDEVFVLARTPARLTISHFQKRFSSNLQFARSNQTSIVLVRY